MQGVRGYRPLTAALLLIPLPVMTSIVAPLSGIARRPHRGACAGHRWAADPGGGSGTAHRADGDHALPADRRDLAPDGLGGGCSSRPTPARP